MVSKTRKTKKISSKKSQNKKTKKIFSKKSQNKKIKKIKILRNFEGSNIGVLSKKVKNSKIKINLKIQKEPYKKQVKRKFQNWFYFKVSSIKNKIIDYEIHNANNYDNDWKNFNVCYSYDNENWKRTKTTIKITIKLDIA